MRSRKCLIFKDADTKWFIFSLNARFSFRNKRVTYLNMKTFFQSVCFIPLPNHTVNFVLLFISDLLHWNATKIGRQGPSLTTLHSLSCILIARRITTPQTSELRTLHPCVPLCVVGPAPFLRHSVTADRALTEALRAPKPPAHAYYPQTVRAVRTRTDGGRWVRRGSSRHQLVGAPSQQLRKREEGARAQQIIAHLALS